MKTSAANVVSRILTLFYIGLVCFLCFAKLEGAVRVSPQILGIPSDKIAHFIMFFPFPILTFLSFDSLAKKPAQCVVFTIVTLLIGCSFAAGTELVQKWLGYRSADRMDFLADCISMTISSLIVMIINLNIICSKK